MRSLAPMTSQPFPSTVRSGGGVLWRPAGCCERGAWRAALPLDAITFGSEVIGFTADGDRVAIRTATGPATGGDLLIGADGAGSVVHRVLHPSQPPPRPWGIITVRGTHFQRKE